MDGQIGNHAVGNEGFLNIAACQLQPLLGVQLVGQGKLHLAGKLGILSLLGNLHSIPELGAFPHPVGGGIWRDNLGMLDAAAFGVVKGRGGAFIADTFACPIGCGGGRTASGRTGDDAGG